MISSTIDNGALTPGGCPSHRPPARTNISSSPRKAVGTVMNSISIARAILYNVEKCGSDAQDSACCTAVRLNIARSASWLWVHPRSFLAETRLSSNAFIDTPQEKTPAHKEGNRTWIGLAILPPNRSIHLGESFLSCPRGRAHFLGQVAGRIHQESTMADRRKVAL